jgi:hypothetical protein
MALTAEKVSNQVVKMLKNDKICHFSDGVKETNNFRTYIDNGNTILEIKDKTLLGKLKHLVEGYKYPQLLVKRNELPNVDHKQDLIYIYKQWVLEEYGKKHYPCAYEGFAHTENTIFYDRNCDGNTIIKGINSMPFHIEYAIRCRLTFENEYPRKGIYKYEYLYHCPRCELI